MEIEIAGWAGVVLRFVHVVAAIMWIGNSLLFTWMELNLLPPRRGDADKSLLGYLDMLHGGGVFHLQKRVLDPKEIPVPLHWFMWQSYTTWISGVALLVAVFYIGGGSALLDATKTGLPGWGAILLSAGGIVGGWLVYDGLWNSRLKDKPVVAIPVSLALLIGAAAFYNEFFNGRAVWLQIGAMMGSFMSANVFFHIIRNQKKFMASLESGAPHDPAYGKAAKTRSLHNHYMTFPVLFLMLSAHFPQLTSASRSVAILAVVVVSLMAVKHLMNIRYRFQPWLGGIISVFLVAVLAIGFLIGLPSRSQAVMAGGEGMSADAIAGGKLFIGQGCATCHQAGGSQLGPSLNGIYGRNRELTDGSVVVADSGYLRTAIEHPTAQVVKGYPAAMPSFPQLDEREVGQLVDYIKTLR
jgi:uncharacterized membrane protein